MFRHVALATALLLSLDGASTVLSPFTGVSLTQDAEAADFTGRVKRIRIKRQRSGEGYRVTMPMVSDDNSTAAAASLELRVCEGDVCAEPVVVGQDEYTGRFRSERFAYDGAMVPMGSFTLQSSLKNLDGKAVGEPQKWALEAADGEMVIEPLSEAKEGPHVTGLDLTSDDCGNGKALAHVSGDGADTVGSVEWVSLDGILFAKDEASLCEGLPCVTGSLAGSRSTFTESKADLGELGASLLEREEAAVTLTVSALHSDGTVIGTATVEATAKYGDILIDGVPLEFD